jgi:hypothetical protein
VVNVYEYRNRVVWFIHSDRIVGCRVYIEYKWKNANEVDNPSKDNPKKVNHNYIEITIDDNSINVK